MALRNGVLLFPLGITMMTGLLTDIRFRNAGHGLVSLGPDRAKDRNPKRRCLVQGRGEDSLVQ